MTRSRPPRPTAAVLAAAAALALVGCSATNPIQTDRGYAASDGVRVTLDDLRVENLLAVTTAAGEPGALSGALVNDGAADARVTLAAGDSTAELAVPAGGSVLFGTGSGAGERVELDEVAAAPGALLEVTVTADTAGSATVQVPVLDGARPPYDAVLAAG